MIDYTPHVPILDEPQGTIVKVGINNCVSCQLTEGVLTRLRERKPDANIISYHLQDGQVADFAELYEARSFPFIVLIGTEATVITAREASLNKLTKFIETYE